MLSLRHITEQLQKQPSSFPDKTHTPQALNSASVKFKSHYWTAGAAAAVFPWQDPQAINRTGCQVQITLLSNLSSSYCPFLTMLSTVLSWQCYQQNKLSNSNHITEQLEQQLLSFPDKSLKSSTEPAVELLLSPGRSWTSGKSLKIHNKQSTQ